MYITHNTELIVKYLNAFYDKHKHDIVSTGDTNFALVCKSAANRLKEQESEFKFLKAKYGVVDSIFESNKGSCIASTYCKVDTRTKEVFDIGENRVDENGYIFINGLKYPVSKKGSGTEYWFE